MQHLHLHLTFSLVLALTRNSVEYWAGTTEMCLTTPPPLRNVIFFFTWLVQTGFFLLNLPVCHHPAVTGCIYLPYLSVAGDCRCHSHTGEVSLPQ